MIAYWSRFAAAGNPNGAATPKWPLYQARTDDQLALRGCASDPSSTRAAAACSKITRDFDGRHRTGFWQELLS